MLLGGLWHGASWNFVIWGAVHGLLLALHRMWGGYVERGLPQPLRKPMLVRRLSTFVLVTLTWIWFRADSFSAATSYFRGLVFNPWSPTDLPAVGFVFFLGFLTLSMDLLQRQSGKHFFVADASRFSIGVVLGLWIAGIVIGSGGEVEQFIYFQF